MPDSKPLKKDKETISGMFNSIAGTYDFLNHFLSFGIDRSWRRKLVRKIVSESGVNTTQSSKSKAGCDTPHKAEAPKVLDIACGTGDTAIALDKKGMNVTGADISVEMLAVARKKAPHITFQYGDAAGLDFPDNSFDAVSITFGIRNFDDRAVCLKEIYRVLKPGGLLCIAEFSIPRNKLWKALYSFYFRTIPPLAGKLISGQKQAYTYLPESSFDFPAPELFAGELKSGGFSNVSFRSMTGGVAYLYEGRK